MDDQVLDLPDERRRNQWPEWLLYAAVVCCAYWFAADLLRWPYALEALASGCILLLVSTIWSFALKGKKAAYSYGYFAGKLCLICAVFAHLGKGPYTMYFVIGAAAGFLWGIVVLSFRSEGSE